MDKAEVAALQEYEDALTEFLTSVRARDGRSDFPLRQRLYAAGIQIERLRAPQRTMTRFCAPIEIHGRVECKKPPVGCFASPRCVILIDRASRRHLANAISWSARVSLFTFPRHTGDKVSIPPHGNVHHRQVLLN